MARQFLLRFLILVLVVFGCYGISVGINLLADSDQRKQHEFTYLKRTADRFWKEKEFKKAARHYKELAHSDRQNFGAWMRYARSLDEDVYRLVEDKRNRDGENLNQLNANIKELSSEAIIAYEEAIRFPQFRNRNRFRLSLLYGLVDQTEKSGEILKTALDEGWIPNPVAVQNWFDYYECESVLDAIEFQKWAQAQRRQF